MRLSIALLEVARSSIGFIPAFIRFSAETAYAYAIGLGKSGILDVSSLALDAVAVRARRDARFLLAAIAVKARKVVTLEIVLAFARILFGVVSRFSRFAAIIEIIRALLI